MSAKPNAATFSYFDRDRLGVIENPDGSRLRCSNVSYEQFEKFARGYRAKVAAEAARADEFVR